MPAQPPLHGPPVAAAPARADAVDLDTRIRLAEQHLLARELRLRTHVQDLGQRVSRAAAPRALLLKLGGLAVAGGCLAWAWRRGRHGGEAPADPLPSAPAGSPPRRLLSLLPLAWPLLPARWRRHISPAAAATLIGMAAPLIQRLLARQVPGADRQPAGSA